MAAAVKAAAAMASVAATAAIGLCAGCDEAKARRHCTRDQCLFHNALQGTRFTLESAERSAVRREREDDAEGTREPFQSLTRLRIVTSVADRARRAIRRRRD